jgi:hypothetical protein
LPAFKRFGPDDQLDNVLILEPTWVLASGSAGWRGSPEGSASVSLYGGYNRQAGGVLREYRFQRTIQGTDSFGVLARSEPITASVHYVWMTNEDLALTARTGERWGREHWKVVQRLYDDYYATDPDYITASYDYYSVYFQKDSVNVVSLPVYIGDFSYNPTGSFTLESWINPFLTQSVTNDFTIQSLKGYFWFGITGSNGRLAFSSSLGLFQASSGPTQNRWSHVALAFSSASLTGTFYLDLQNVGTFTLSSSLQTSGGKPLLGVGNLLTGSSLVTDTVTNSGSLRRSFHGLIGESRFWLDSRSYVALSSSYDRRLTVAERSGVIALTELNDGPLRSFKWSTSQGAGATFNGSGTMNLTSLNNLNLGILNGFSRVGPVWQPNDNVRFRPDKSLAPTSTSASFFSSDVGPAPVLRSADLRQMVVISVPTAIYGRSIARNSLSLTCRAYSSASHGLVRTLIDDGRGGLFISGSIASGSTESYRGVEWNKVGNVFYGEGLIIIKDPALFDFGRTDGSSAHPNDTFQLSFRGESRIPVKTFMCRIERGDLNASLNPTFWEEEEDGSRVRTQPSGNLYVTTVGLYNSERELVGVARLAEPLRVRPRDRMNVKLRLDF